MRSDYVSQLVLLVAAAVLGSTEACTKEEYAAKFGETYEILARDPALPTPAKVDGKIELAVRYLSQCKNGGSEFVSVHS